MDLPAIYPKEYSKMEEDKFYEKYLGKGINKFISDYSNSTIIFVGLNTKPLIDFKNTGYIDIPAKYKFYIEIPEIESLKRRFNRHIDFIKSNSEYYFDKKLKKKPLSIDFDDWKKKIKSINKSYYKNQDYQFLENESIYQSIKKIISKKVKINK